MRFKFSILFFLFFSILVIGQNSPLVSSDSIAQQIWVEEHYNAMSLEQKIGQLFMVSVASNEGKAATEKIKKQIEEEHIGGVIFLRGGPVRQAQLTNEYQALSRLPLLIGMDAEWGLSMRLDSTYAFPYNTTLGAITDSSVVQKVGKRIGEHAKRLGVHINFAPDIDVNINPLNPIIGSRSFGEDRESVARNGIAMMKGMQSAGILTTGKHFPGHGDTATDSHHALPEIPFTRERLDSIELYPYKKLIAAGINSIMVAHLSVPSMEIKENYPSSLSEQIISAILKEEMGFEGLVFTDALNMKAVSNYAAEGEVELSAFIAGNDILLMPIDVKKAKAKLLEAYNDGRITESRLATSVKKILMAKYKVGLSHYQPINMTNLKEDLHTIEDDLVYSEAMENAITVVKNNFALVPIKNLENKKIAYVKLGDADHTPFLKELKKYAVVDFIEGNSLSNVKSQLADYNLVIVGFHKSDESPWKPYKFGVTEKTWLKEIAGLRTSNTILTVFAKPYALLDIDSFEGVDGVVMGYQNSDIAQEKTAQVLFGALAAKGKLPVSANPVFPVNTGIKVASIKRLGYGIPESVGLSSSGLAKVDKLVNDGLDSLMFPGAQVLVARKGKVVYEKAFGKPTYNATKKVTTDDIYDLASLTKILATLPMIMKMEEEHKIALNNTFQQLIPAYKESDLKDVTVLKALSHYGRLPAWIAFYVDTLGKDRKPSQEFYRSHQEQGFSTQVFNDLYLADAYQDSIYNRIGRQSLKPNRYRYSDVSYYVFKKYIEEKYSQPLDQLAEKFFYKKLGAINTSYNPLNKYAVDRIIPSEIDNYYRYDTIQGYVHDMGAAMQGGVGGHAGLFSNANDVAKIMQMYLQGGSYGGDHFLDSRTVKKFNTCYFCDKDVRRGVGFDKPELDHGGPTCGCVSHKSFGHSGFTGTYTWADPEEEIVYVFLSNRTFPTASNTLLVKSGLRTRIQQAIYDSIIN